MSEMDNDVGVIAQEILEGADFNPHAGAKRRTMSEAYAVQDALAGHLTGSGVRGPVAGWKIAANSQALLALFNLDEPASGRVFADQRHASPATVQAAEFADFAYEPEVAAVIKTTLAPGAAPFDQGQVLSAIDRFVPALELLDMRGVHMPSCHIPDVVAQNVTNAGAVIGGPGVPAADLDPAEVRTVVTISGAPELDVTGNAPQPPVEAVLWLANHLAARGLALEAGQIVLCGTHAPIRRLAGAAMIDVKMSGLGTVSLTLE